MRLESFEGERRVSELVERFYAISGRGAKAKAARARQALLEANPQLAELRRLPEGALIVVPEVAGVERVPPQPGTRPARPALEALRQAVERGAEEVAASLERAAARASEEAASLKNREVRAALRQTPELEKAAEAASSAAAKRADRAKQLQRLSTQAVRLVADDLEAFARAMGAGALTGEAPSKRRSR